MKPECLLARNWLKEATGGALHAILSGVAHEPRTVLAHLQLLYLCAIVT